MRIYFLTWILCSVPFVLLAQDWAGSWRGVVYQEGKTDTFIYAMELEQLNEKVFGTATSESKMGGVKAKFEIGGIWDGQRLTLQEVKQLEPPKAKWCLKHIRLKAGSNVNILTGDWEAQGCTPGKINLQRPVAQEETIPTVAVEPVVPGKYTGTLSQSDREYGFYFEMLLAEDGTGYSRIVSDGEGGNAKHLLNWTYNEDSHQVYFEESEIDSKSVADWPWCIKKGTLSWIPETNRIAISGSWDGYIEGYTLEDGACAPGKLYVEQPIFKPVDLRPPPAAEPTETKAPSIPDGVVSYAEQTTREVEVNRVLEVKNNTVRVRVWDNGTIDGDVLSLFVNGEMILENYRVTRRKHETIVKLDKPTNYIILHALNLGSISPNTVAVSVDDGIEEQVVIMSSNLDKSGAIMIRQFTVGE